MKKTKKKKKNAKDLENYISNKTKQRDRRRVNTRQHDTTRHNTNATRDNTRTTRDNRSTKLANTSQNQ